MTGEEFAMLKIKYDHKASGQFDVKFSDAARDINAILDACGGVPNAEHYRKKYRSTRQEHVIIFWIVSNDVNALLPFVRTAEIVGLTLDETKGETLPDTTSSSNLDPLTQTGESK